MSEPADYRLTTFSFTEGVIFVLWLGSSTEDETWVWLLISFLVFGVQKILEPYMQNIQKKSSCREESES